jgi:hypothetical protein
MGTWRVTDGTANIEIAPCGNALCGTVAWTDQPDQKDNKNPDVSQRNRPVLGITVLQNMEPQRDKWVGSVYNARDGHTYDAKISMHGDDTLRLEGCLPGGVICGGQNWSRIAQPSVAAAPAVATSQPQASVPAQQQVGAPPHVTENTSKGLPPLDLDFGLSQITPDQAADAARSAADLINQMLMQHDVRGGRIDPGQAAAAASSAAKMIRSISRCG